LRKGFAKAHLQTGVLAGAWVAVRNASALLATWRGESKARARDDLYVAGDRLGKRWQDATLAWHMAVESLPVGISLLLRNYIWRAGVVLTVIWLGQQQGDLVNGVLYGPLRAVQQLRIIPAAFAAAMLPVFSNRVGARQDEFDGAFAKSIKLFTALSLLIALTFTFLADPMVKLLLGDMIDLKTAALVLIVLGWVIVLYFPNWLYGVTLVALGKQKLETVGLIVGVIVGYIVARWGIPFG
jgi:O-antigen/teichoic acid export membrane protein